ncbi:MAG: DsbA family protein [Rhodobacteraceae bacterium]|nr:DsbA family protein [Paracoccaceae bacterium]
MRSAFSMFRYIYLLGIGLVGPMRRVLGIGFLLLFMASPINAFDLENLSSDEKAIFGELVKEYLLDNPEILLDVIDRLEELENEANLEMDREFIEFYADEIFHDPNSWVGGNPEGELNLVEFVDYRCGYCRRAQQVIQDLIEANSDLRLVIREFPILGEQSDISSRLAIAVFQLAGPEQYEMIHDLLLSLEGPVSEKVISEVAEMTSLDVQTLMDKMVDSSVLDVLDTNYQLAQALEINATPTFILGGEVIRGFLTLEEFQYELDQLKTATN